MAIRARPRRRLVRGRGGRRARFLTDSDFNPYHPLNLANSPAFFKILPRCPTISPVTWGGRTGLCCDPGRWLARERSGHVCPTRGHANWAGFGQSGSFPQPERGVRLA